MTLEDALASRLTGLPVRTVGWTRQIQALPAVTLQVIADPRPQHMKGFQSVRQTTVQVDAWGATATIARTVRDAAIAALTPARLVGGVQFQRALITNIRSGPEQQQPGPAQPRVRAELHRESIDFIFTHNAN